MFMCLSLVYPHPGIVWRGNATTPSSHELIMDTDLPAEHTWYTEISRLGGLFLCFIAYLF